MNEIGKVNVSSNYFQLKLLSIKVIELLPIKIITYTERWKMTFSYYYWEYLMHLTLIGVLKTLLRDSKGIFSHIK